MDIASACLIGRKCRYDGEARENEEVKRLYLEGKIKAVCPECLAGLKSPRCPSEIVGGDGNDVLDGKASVVAQDGGDRTQEFIEGAYKMLDAAKACGAAKGLYEVEKPLVRRCGHIRRHIFGDA